MTYRTIGNTVIEWQDSDPFVFTLTQPTGPRDRREQKSITIDFTRLRQGFTDDFLSAFKQHLMERCNKIKLISVNTEKFGLQALFTRVIELKLFKSKINLIDESFLICLAAKKSSFQDFELKYLKLAHSTTPHSTLFAQELTASDFPTNAQKKGSHGRQIDNILVKVLTRSAAAHILDVCDIAYAKGEMSIDYYSFAHLSFAVFVRPNSYRQIRVSDLTVTTSGQYFLDIVTSKTGEEYPSKVTYRINEHLGILLQKQRQHVIDKYGHLVAQEDIKKLALFPTRGIRKDHSQWQSEYASEHYGMCATSTIFSKRYPCAIKQKHFNNEKLTLSANALRHTVGTLLAQTGASEKTLQAVMKHASATVCRAYVDIAFHGLAEELSKAMKPAFQEHLPALINFRSQDDLKHSEKQVMSWEQETGKLESIGECGKNIVCANAPIVCYGCVRFTPCWDADHIINLRIVEREIEDMSKRGKPFEHMVDRARSAKNHIILAMNAADRYRDALEKVAQA